MPLRRLLSGTLVALAALVCWAIAPASAEAALLDPAQPVVETAAPPVQKAAADVVRAADTVTGSGQASGDAGTPAPQPGAVQMPAPQPDSGAVHQTIAPVAAAGGTAVSSAQPPAAPAARVDEGHRSRVSHISASTASAERLSAARAAHGHNADGALRAATASTRPATHGVAAGESSGRPGASEALARPAASPALPDPEPTSGLAGADASTAVSSGFSLGGGLALLVAALLLAGPRLRRRLLLLPAVCRPAAFHVVLERPG